MTETTTTPAAAPPPPRRPGALVVSMDVASGKRGRDHTAVAITQVHRTDTRKAGHPHTGQVLRVERVPARHGEHAALLLALVDEVHADAVAAGLRVCAVIDATGMGAGPAVEVHDGLRARAAADRRYQGPGRVQYAAFTVTSGLKLSQVPDGAGYEWTVARSLIVDQTVTALSNGALDASALDPAGAQLLGKELAGLTAAGRIDHRPGGHDDAVFAVGMGWVWGRKRAPASGTYAVPDMSRSLTGGPPMR